MKVPVPVPLIAAILGPYGPPTNVANNSPLVEAALDAAAIYSPLCAVAAIATISVETRRFCPIKQRSSLSYLRGLYENRKDLGNDQPGDSVRFCGRGVIPIIGRRSYEHFGVEIGKDLARNPDLRDRSRDRCRDPRSLFQRPRRACIGGQAKLEDGQASREFRCDRMAAIFRRGVEAGRGAQVSTGEH